MEEGRREARKKNEGWKAIVLPLLEFLDAPLLLLVLLSQCFDYMAAAATHVQHLMHDVYTQQRAIFYLSLSFSPSLFHSPLYPLATPKSCCIDKLIRTNINISISLQVMCCLVFVTVDSQQTKQ